MTRQEIAKKIVETGIVPVIRATSAALASQAVEAVCAGGIPVVEITMTVPGAIDLMLALTKQMGKDVLMGAGTVLDAETLCAAAAQESSFWSAQDWTWQRWRSPIEKANS